MASSLQRRPQPSPVTLPLFILGGAIAEQSKQGREILDFASLDQPLLRPEASGVPLGLAPS